MNERINGQAPLATPLFGPLRLLVFDGESLWQIVSQLLIVPLSIAHRSFIAHLLVILDVSARTLPWFYPRRITYTRRSS